MRESSATPGRRWVRSVESDNLDELTKLGADAAEEMFNTWIIDYVEPSVNIHARYEYPKDEWAEFVEEAVNRTHYVEASSREKSLTDKALMGDPRWVYGRELSSDGLWEESVPRLTAPVDALSRFVISSCLGNAIAANKPSLIERAGEFADTHMDRAIVLGGAAVYAVQNERWGSSQGSAYGFDDDDGVLRWETSVGGDIHGDFRSRRYARPISPITNNLRPDLKHHFMPAVYECSVAAYHGAETDIVAEMIYHLVARVGKSRQSVYDSLSAAISTVETKNRGNFADYGDESGMRSSMMLRMRLDGLGGGGRANFRARDYAIFPGVEDQLTRIQSVEGGVKFSFVEKDLQSEKMIIPDKEIESYIVQMVKENGGRTSPEAIMQIVRALSTERL